MIRHRTTPLDPGRHSASRIDLSRRAEAVAVPESDAPPLEAKHVRLAEPDPTRSQAKHARAKHARVLEPESVELELLLPAEAEPDLVAEPERGFVAEPGLVAAPEAVLAAGPEPSAPRAEHASAKHARVLDAEPAPAGTGPVPAPEADPTTPRAKHARAKHARAVEPEPPHAEAAPVPVPEVDSAPPRAKHARAKHAREPQPESVATQPDPDATQPEPEPEVAATLPEPEATQPEPEATQSEPEATQREPEAAQPEPEPQPVLEPAYAEAEPARAPASRPRRARAKHAGVHLHQAAVAPGWRGSWRLVSVVSVVGALGLLGGMRTMAYWSDTATASGQTVTSGSLDLLVDGQQGNPGTYSWSSLVMTNMAPGESKAATVTLSNAGTTPFTISATGTATGNLDPHVNAMVMTGGSATSDLTYPRTETCQNGTQTFDQTLGNSGKTVIASTSTINPGDSLVVCVRLTLASNAPNSMQGKSYTPVFVFTASQAAS